MSRRGTKRSVTEVDAQIGSRIRARRLALGLSQTALSRALGVTFQQIQKYEMGTNRVSGSRLVTMADTLKLSTSDLLGPGSGTGEPDVVLEIMRTKEGLALARAFADMADRDQRAALVRLAETMAKAGRNPSTP